RRARRFATGAWLACALAMVAAPATASGERETSPLLHAMFGDHAVLQRGQPLRVWGLAAPGEQVRVELAGKRASARADEQGRWEALLPRYKAGGPHVLEVSAGGRSQQVRDVLIGDVWLCSGQSNMELQVWRALDARAEIAGADNDRIRMLTVPQTAGVVPRATFPEAVEWQPVNPESVREFSAACYFFARELQKHVDVP